MTQFRTPKTEYAHSGLLSVSYSPRVYRVSCSVVGVSRHLFTVEGSCKSIGVRLDTPALVFGSVVCGSSLQKDLVLENTGDIECEYHWDVDILGRHYRCARACENTSSL